MTVRKMTTTTTHLQQRFEQHATHPVASDARLVFPTSRRWLRRSYRKLMETGTDYDTTLPTFAAHYRLRATESRTPAYLSVQISGVAKGGEGGRPPPPKGLIR